ncbi:hypothetical protein E306M_06520 [Moorella sp. E306M]|nr:hypothetical protein E306M_06520 [Moorella sp. E306M]
MNREKERVRQCLMANCRDYPRCRVKWGRDCIRQMGRKIPRLRSWGPGLMVISVAPGEEIRVRRVSGDPYYG